MGRGVSLPCGAFPAYQSVEHVEDSEDWQDFLEDVKYQAKRIFPSMDDHDEWIGREDHALLKNNFAFVGVSEYMGLASIWLVVRSDAELEGLAKAWVNKAYKKFERIFSEYEKIGTFSNGESVYKKVN